MSDTFNTITAADWRRTFQAARQSPSEKHMKSLIALLLLGTARLTASTDLIFLEAISSIESGHSDKAISPICGARGRYQITEGSWKSVSEWPHSYAHNSLKSQVVALKLLNALKKELGMKHGDEDYLRLSYAWMAGSGYASKRETNEQLIARLSYGERCMAIFSELKNIKK